jgi:hypothetical protein
MTKIEKPVESTFIKIMRERLSSIFSFIHKVDIDLLLEAKYWE